jgi:hypothetical protein
MNEASDRAKALLADIQRVFSGVTRGGGTSLWASIQIDDYLPVDQIVESPEAQALDPGTDWTRIPPEWLSRFGGKGGFSFVDARGFRYYLPALMTLFIREAEGLVETKGCLTEFLIYHLDGEDSLNHFSILDREQARVVRRFLEYVSTSPHYESLDVRTGLEGHWKQFED